MQFVDKMLKTGFSNFLSETIHYGGATVLLNRYTLVTSPTNVLLSSSPGQLGPRGMYSLTDTGVHFNISSMGEEACIDLGEPVT